MIVYMNNKSVKGTGLHFSRKKSYDLSDGKHELGVLCSRGHRVWDGDGKLLEKSVRFSANRSCVVCARQTAKKSLREDPAESIPRRRLEDLNLAKELGISVDEL